MPLDVTILDPGSSKKDTGKTGDNGSKRKKGIIGTIATCAYYVGSVFNGNVIFGSDL